MSDSELKWKKRDIAHINEWHTDSEENKGLYYMILEEEAGFVPYVDLEDGDGFSRISVALNTFSKAVAECENNAFQKPKRSEDLQEFTAIMKKFLTLSDKEKTLALSEIKKVLDIY